MNIIYDIKNGRLYNDLDCPFDSEINKIDVYSSVYWTARTEKEYAIKEKTINDFSFEDDLVKANAWCDISGYDYWVIQQEEPNYVSIDVYLKKPVDDYTQEEIKHISELITKWDEMFLCRLID